MNSNMYKEMKEEVKSLIYDKCMESLFKERLNKYEKHLLLIECMNELVEELKNI